MTLRKDSIIMKLKCKENNANCSKNVSESSPGIPKPPLIDVCENRTNYYLLNNINLNKYLN